MKKRYENPPAVEVEIDADGWPHIIVWTAEGTVDAIVCKPKGNAEIRELPTGPGYDGNYSALRRSQ